MASEQADTNRLRVSDQICLHNVVVLAVLECHVWTRQAGSTSCMLSKVYT